MRVRNRDLLAAVGVDVIDREAMAELPVYLHSLEHRLIQAQDELIDNDHLSDAVADACNVVRVLLLAAMEGRSE